MRKIELKNIKNCKVTDVSFVTFCHFLKIGKIILTDEGAK